MKQIDEMRERLYTSLTIVGQIESAAEAQCFHCSYEQFWQLADSVNDNTHLLALVEEKDKQIAELEKERDAAVDAIIEIFKKPVDNICYFCKNTVACDKACEFFEEGVGATGKDGKAYPDFKWSCMDFDFGTCQKLEGTACNGCYDNDYSGFKFRGTQEEE